ncbi:MAG: rubredoxin [Scytonematopsis contorta HA4267-MV1]|jgi:rubredoxin|nr:rubredoxin [Scytonematopsis contorta HA4267-MV1]
MSEQVEKAEQAAQAEQTEQVAVQPPELDGYECLACGYVYDPDKGDESRQVAPGTAFPELSITWRCPVCGAKKAAFKNIGSVKKVSGFRENLGYGFGVNTMTPSQKNLLIFGAMGIAVLFFLSLYGLK